ncbi:storkhead-box protein 1-like [Mastacembelus armatus]|uniref:storkhead-box protein 1-like n=1 Tax=Mastacembelus armatus TaxID=205130 RepID=UPI000E45C65A|nr:storkhead-box protein 1-like [Mastacembelus armatus]
MENFLQIAPHSLALVLSRVRKEDEEGSPPPPSSSSSPTVLPVKSQHHTGYEVFANFKAVNMQHFWNKALTHALSEIFFLGWIDEHVLLIQGKEVHLQVLRNGWNRRTLKPPQGFDIKCIVNWSRLVVTLSPLRLCPVLPSHFASYFVLPTVHSHSTHVSQQESPQRAGAATQDMIKVGETQTEEGWLFKGPLILQEPNW